MVDSPSDSPICMAFEHLLPRNSRLSKKRTSLAAELARRGWMCSSWRFGQRVFSKSPCILRFDLRDLQGSLVQACSQWPVYVTNKYPQKCEGLPQTLHIAAIQSCEEHQALHIASFISHNASSWSLFLSGKTGFILFFGISSSSKRLATRLPEAAWRRKPEALEKEWGWRFNEHGLLLGSLLMSRFVDPTVIPEVEESPELMSFGEKGG